MNGRAAKESKKKRWGDAHSCTSSKTLVPKRLARNPKNHPLGRYEKKRNSAGVGDEDVKHFCPKMGSPKTHGGKRAVKAKVFFFAFLKGGKVKSLFSLSTSHPFVRWDD